MESKRRIVCLKQETTYVLHSRLGTISVFYFLSLPPPPPPYRGRSYLIFLVRTTEDCLRLTKKDRGCLLLLIGGGGTKKKEFPILFSAPPPVAESSWFEFDHVTNYVDMVSGTQNHVTPHRQSRWRRTGSSSVLLFLDQHHGKKLASIHQKTQTW